MIRSVLDQGLNALAVIRLECLIVFDGFYEGKAQVIAGCVFVGFEVPAQFFVVSLPGILDEVQVLLDVVLRGPGSLLLRK